MSKILALLWIVFLAFFISGGKTVYVFQGLFAFSALFLALYPKREKVSLRLLGYLKFILNPQTIVVFCALVVISVLAGLILDYEALHGTLWDLGQYISATYNFAEHGRPTFFFHGNEMSNYFAVHSSISIFILALLYKIIAHPWVVILWQGIFLVTPAFIAMLWYRAVSVQLKIKPEPLAYLLAFFVYSLTPVFLGQQFWPFVFHVAGLSLLAFAYLFYYQKKWIPWFICLFFLSIEKEDFGFISSVFGAMVGLEALLPLVLKRNSRIKAAQAYLPAALGFVLFVWGFAYFIYYGSHVAHTVTFDSKFGQLGKTPEQLISTALLHPLMIFKLLLRPLSFNYAAFFLISSMVWIYPRWRVFRFLVPVLPTLFLNCIAVEGTMQMFKDHYALSIVIGSCATVVLGLWSAYLENNKVKTLNTRAYALLAFSALLPLCWNHESTFRHFKEAYVLFRERKDDRQAIQPIRKDKDLVVCCEDRLCTALIDRPMALNMNSCAKGSAYLDSFRGKNAIYIVYDNTSVFLHPEGPHAYVPVPTQWVYQSKNLKISGPIRVK